MLRDGAGCAVNRSTLVVSPRVTSPRGRLVDGEVGSLVQDPVGHRALASLR